MNKGGLIYCISEHFKFVRQKQAISRADYFFVDGKTPCRLMMLNYCYPPCLFKLREEANKIACNPVLVQANC